MTDEKKSLVITVVGLGYVGLPTALAFHEQGFTVIGVDNSSEKIEMLGAGVDPLVDATADNKIPINSPSWKVTTDYLAAIPESDIVIITVPTPTFPDKSPNLDYVRSASKSVLESLNLEGHTTVVLESTVYPGVTRKTFVELSDELGPTIGDIFCNSSDIPSLKNRLKDSTCKSNKFGTVNFSCGASLCNGTLSRYVLYLDKFTPHSIKVPGTQQFAAMPGIYSYIKKLFKFDFSALLFKLLFNRFSFSFF